MKIPELDNTLPEANLDPAKPRLIGLGARAVGWASKTGAGDGAWTTGKSVPLGFPGAGLLENLDPAKPGLMELLKEADCTG